MNQLAQSLGTSLNRGFTVVMSVKGEKYVDGGQRRPD